ncbi:MAG: FKBP-type peptidyl-prolyl cis-trans isomerase [Candidatus Thermoplasmatota archaeon]|nr:FKBP-type peptidyl-prolyl cis-trans isomerase [Candidatus Thermoplasmatota archaeon]
MDESDKKIAIFVMIICIGLVAYGGYRWAASELGKGDVPELVVERGDRVTVEYVGYLEDGRIYNEPRVFDTNIQEAADENNTYPKTASYVWREASPFTFTAGAGNVIVGWELNILGMKKGETATWDIPAEDAYTPRLEELVVEYNLTETCPIYETISRQDFTQQYSGHLPIADSMVTHAYWGWPARIHSSTETKVTLLNLPLSGERYITGYGWETRITALDQAANDGKGIITMVHEPQLGENVNLIHMGYFDSSLGTLKNLRDAYQRGGDGMVVGIDTTTFTVDYNSETYGIPLRFRVTVLEITKAL